jgi:hypothetical protein
MSVDEDLICSFQVLKSTTAKKNGAKRPKTPKYVN